MFGDLNKREYLLFDPKDRANLYIDKNGRIVLFDRYWDVKKQVYGLINRRSQQKRTKLEEYKKKCSIKNWRSEVNAAKLYVLFNLSEVIQARWKRRKIIASNFEANRLAYSRFQIIHMFLTNKLNQVLFDAENDYYYFTDRFMEYDVNELVLYIIRQYKRALWSTTLLNELQVVNYDYLDVLFKES